MTPQEQLQVQARLAVLSEIFNKALSPTVLQAYTDRLDDLPAQDVIRAMNQALDTCKFMPTIAEIRELVLGKAQDAAEAAWGELLTAIRQIGHWGQPELPEATWRAVGQLWGSWAHLCQTLPAEGPELLGWKKQWNATYEASTRTERRLESARDPDELGPSRDDARTILARIQAGRK